MQALKLNTIILFLVFCKSFLFNHSLQSQTSSNQSDTANTPYDTPFNKARDYKNWCIKGKVLPEIFMVGSGIGASLGFEYGITKNQSIGIDYVYHAYSFHSPDVYDSVAKKYNVGPRQGITDEALFLNYRYYLNAQRVRKQDGIVPYVGCFTRVAKQTYTYDKGYVKKDDVIREYQRSIGIMYGLLGILNNYRTSGPFVCIDAYAGIFIKQKERIHEYPGVGNQLERRSDFPINYGFRIGLNFSLVFEREVIKKAD